MRLATDKVFGQRKENGEFHFRLFLVGDMSVLDPNLTEAMFESGREPMKAAIQIRMLGNSALLTCRVETQHEFDGDVVTLVVGDQSFMFTLRTQ